MGTLKKLLMIAGIGWSPLLYLVACPEAPAEMHVLVLLAGVVFNGLMFYVWCLRPVPPSQEQR